VLRREIADGHLGAVLAIEHQVPAEELRERLGLPRKRRAGRILDDCLATVRCDRVAVRIENDERRDAAHLEFLGERFLALAVGERQREPRHLAEVLVERLLVAVRADEDALDLEALRFVRLVLLGELGREAAARRAPVSAEVQHQVLRREIADGHLGAVLAIEHQVPAEELRERLGLPRKRRAGRILDDCLATVRCDRVAVRIENDERRDAAHLELLGERLLALAVGERQREPRHLAEVLAE